MVGQRRDFYSATNKWLSIARGGDFDTSLIIEPPPLRHAPLPPPVNISPSGGWRRELVSLVPMRARRLRPAVRARIGGRGSRLLSPPASELPAAVDRGEPVTTPRPCTWCHGGRGREILDPPVAPYFRKLSEMECA